MFCKKGDHRISGKSQENTCGRVSLIKLQAAAGETLTQVFSRKIWKIFKNNYFKELEELKGLEEYIV